MCTGPVISGAHSFSLPPPGSLPRAWWRAGDRLNVSDGFASGSTDNLSRAEDGQSVFAPPAGGASCFPCLGGCACYISPAFAFFGFQFAPYLHQIGMIKTERMPALKKSTQRIDPRRALRIAIVLVVILGFSLLFSGVLTLSLIHI